MAFHYFKWSIEIKQVLDSCQKKKKKSPEKDCETFPHLVPPCFLNMDVESEHLLILISHLLCRTEKTWKKKPHENSVWVTCTSKMYK